VWYITISKDEEVFMRYSHASALAPPALAEALYDISLDRSDDAPNREEIPQARVKVEWPQMANAGRVPRKAPFGNPARHSNTSRTTD